MLTSDPEFPSCSFFSVFLLSDSPTSNFQVSVFELRTLISNLCLLIAGFQFLNTRWPLRDLRQTRAANLFLGFGWAMILGPCA